MTGPRASLFRAALADARGPALGTWVKIPATEVVELVALAGFDFVVIDLEHSPIDLESAFRLIGTALHTGVSPIVRVADLHPGLVQRVLDAGAEGVMVPHVDTPEQARAAAAAVRFPPLGTRGVGATSRAGAWGALPLAEYLRRGQEEVVLIAQVESALGVANAGEIAAVPGVDALLVGAADLSVSEGKTPSDPDVVALIASAIAQGRAAGVPVGNAGAATAAAVRAAVDTGFTFTMLSNDATLLGSAARAAVDAGRSVTFHDEETR
ncbi:HpcH/HpaI aldolase family protein [Modestobacter versicolor]|uniref:2,4-dihydroxyhept-2-ene-1,7-dioic acid aldolase n=1 Tax=Modestobacter versicolor TaxID=429133 RepID=A0A323VDG1_9ACTN|nr:aldolase/citrate lyase family protein [Modestobacter versicolor]MBB3674864.1 2-keto-3-deoxy-L-rhamnonate aldolase RhmA [Modestobacter versicolor]PZA22902.1 2,4-dihydroxyhept-2-ene-1,7-dioic acid aldolase [Modestobacter versicolor]